MSKVGSKGDRCKVKKEYISTEKLKCSWLQAAYRRMMPKGVEHCGFAAQVLFLVLNAFRHHRNSHSLTEIFTVSATTCAQRLSASSEFTRTLLEIQKGISPVLNAFRHHRNSHTLDKVFSTRVYKSCSTPFGIIGIHTPPVGLKTPALDGVLNAFRHHRNSHWIPHHLSVKLCNHVLNAFRHHRNSHGGGDVSEDQSATCSTPFGIIGIHTRHIGQGISSTGCAQRLSAASEFTRVRRVIENLMIQGCSTPFGIIGIHTNLPTEIDH